MLSTVLIILAILFACIFLAWRDDKITALEKRVEWTLGKVSLTAGLEYEQKINKKLVSRLLFVELKSVNSVLDTLNNCFYQIDENGDYDVDTEYRLEDVTDEWWEALSKGELEIVNKIRWWKWLQIFKLLHPAAFPF